MLCGELIPVVQFKLIGLTINGFSSNIVTFAIAIIYNYNGFAVQKILNGSFHDIFAIISFNQRLGDNFFIFSFTLTISFVGIFFISFLIVQFKFIGLIINGFCSNIVTFAIAIIYNCNGFAIQKILNGSFYDILAIISFNQRLGDNFFIFSFTF